MKTTVDFFHTKKRKMVKLQGLNVLVIIKGNTLKVECR